MAVIEVGPIIMLVRSLFVVMSGALAANAVAAEAPRVAALAACPADATGCLEMSAHWDHARTDKPPFASARELRVRGRLEGGRVQAYRLTLPGASRAKGNEFGTVAYLGRSREGRPIVTTDRGALAIETRGVHVGQSGAVAIVNLKTGAVTQSFLGGVAGGTYVIGGAGRIAVLTKGGTCVSAPSSRPGALTAADCSAQSEPAAGLKFSEPVIGAIATAGDVDLAAIRRALPQTRDLGDAALRARVGRLDADHVVVTPWGD